MRQGNVRFRGCHCCATGPVIESWHWKDIYAALAEIVPGFEAPKALEEQPVVPTRFDTTRRDSLGVRLRDIPTALRETIEWLRTDPFAKADP